MPDFASIEEAADFLEQSIHKAAVVKSYTFADQTTTFRDLDDMRAELARLRGMQRPAQRRRFATTSKGA